MKPGQEMADAANEANRVSDAFATTGPVAPSLRSTTCSTRRSR